MNPTVILFVSALGLVIASNTLWAVFLRLGLKWARTDANFQRTLRLSWFLWGLQWSLLLIALAIDYNLVSLSRFIAAIQFLAGIVLPFFIVMHYFKTSFWRTLQSLLPTAISTGAVWLLILLVFRPFLFEAFAIAANSMAPTLLGKHLDGRCAVCGGAAFGSPAPDERWAAAELEMICEPHFHISQVKGFDPELKGADRILVAKFLKPQRWDIVAFRYPSQPEQIYVKRLVGLPGEEIEIKEGAVWANGKKLEPPESIRELQYHSEHPFLKLPLWGSENRPAKLGHDEYFVLGDFTSASMDSRFWEDGAPGHNPFAVPESHLHGVVTHIYWPVKRWRSLQ